MKVCVWSADGDVLIWSGEQRGLYRKNFERREVREGPVSAHRAAGDVVPVRAVAVEGHAQLVFHSRGRAHNAAVVANELDDRTIAVALAERALEARGVRAPRKRARKHARAQNKRARKIGGIALDQKAPPMHHLVDNERVSAILAVEGAALDINALALPKAPGVARVKAVEDEAACTCSSQILQLLLCLKP